jgi:hypothetical protein
MCVVVVAWSVDEMTSIAAPARILTSGPIMNSCLNGVGLSGEHLLVERVGERYRDAFFDERGGLAFRRGDQVESADLIVFPPAAQFEITFIIGRPVRASDSDGWKVSGRRTARAVRACRSARARPQTITAAVNSPNVT